MDNGLDLAYMPSLSVIIPTLNGGSVLRELLVRLHAQVYAEPVEIVVIDSGSTDATLDYAREFSAMIYSIPSREFNHGLTRNHAIAQSTGDLIVLLTQDALPADNHLLTQLAAPYADPGVGGVYARQIPHPAHDCLTHRNLNGHFTGSLTTSIRHLPDPALFEGMSPFERYAFCNFDDVCSSVRRTAWQQIPFTRCDFAEDLDWSKRALFQGWKIVYQPTATVVHSHCRSMVYEYKRTYMCHRKLYELFGLATIPSWRLILRSFTYCVLHDWAYTLRHGRSLREKIALLGKIPGLAAAGVLGQYLGARDERLNCGKRQAGV